MPFISFLLKKQLDWIYNCFVVQYVLKTKDKYRRKTPFTCSESRYPSYLLIEWGEKTQLFIPPLPHL